MYTIFIEETFGPVRRLTRLLMLLWRPSQLLSALAQRFLHSKTCLRLVIWLISLVGSQVNNWRINTKVAPMMMIQTIEHVEGCTACLALLPLVFHIHDRSCIPKSTRALLKIFCNLRKPLCFWMLNCLYGFILWSMQNNVHAAQNLFYWSELQYQIACSVRNAAWIW